MRRKRDPAADQAIWTRYLADVQPLPGRAAPQTPQEPIASPAESAITEPAPARPRPAAKRAPLSPVAVGAAPAGLDRGTWQRFHKNRIPPTTILDLHGMTAARAHAAVSGLIQGAAARGERCVEIVTGHGRHSADREGGILRREVPLWLNMPPLRVLVLALAHPHPANPGAIRVLIRRDRAHGD